MPTAYTWSQRIFRRQLLLSLRLSVYVCHAAPGLKPGSPDPGGRLDLRLHLRSTTNQRIYNMGSCHSWMLTIEHPAPDLNNLIIKAASKMKDFSYPGEPSFQDFIWFKRSPEIKWLALDFSSQLSKQFPEVVFRLDCEGDSTFTLFFLNGENLDEGYIWRNPRFPSLPLFNEKLKEHKKDLLEKERVLLERELAATQERMSKEIERLKAKQKELEIQLLA